VAWVLAQKYPERVSKLASCKYHPPRSGEQTSRSASCCEAGTCSSSNSHLFRTAYQPQ
jgi:hypothetical protein